MKFNSPGEFVYISCSSQVFNLKVKFLFNVYPMDKSVISSPEMGVNSPVLRRSARLNRPAAGAVHEGIFTLNMNYHYMTVKLNSESSRRNDK